MELERLMAELTPEEMAALVSGTDFKYTNPIPRLGMPSLCMADGPHGLRKQRTRGDSLKAAARFLKKTKSQSF